MNKRAVGAQKEALAAAYLREQGCQILQMNFRTRYGEIDLIVRDPEGVLCFVEVKYRSSGAAGDPAEAVTASKQRTICRTADFYRVRYAVGADCPCRFDVISVLGSRITWYKHAFPYLGAGW